jgi:hypothetical protein
LAGNAATKTQNNCKLADVFFIGGESVPITELISADQK